MFNETRVADWLTTEIFYPGLPADAITDRVQRHRGNSVGTVEVTQAETIQLQEKVEVELFVVAAHSRSLGVLGLVSVAELLPLGGVPAVGDTLDVDTEEGVALELHQFSVEGTHSLWFLPDGDGSVLLDSLLGFVWRLRTNWC